MVNFLFSTNQEVQRKAESAQDQAAPGQAGLPQGDRTEGPCHPETGERPGVGHQPFAQGHTHTRCTTEHHPSPFNANYEMFVPDKYVCL